MKISELVTKLNALRATEGDLDVVHEQGEFNDLYLVDKITTIEVDKTGEEWKDFYRVRPGGRVANAKAVELS